MSKETITEFLGQVDTLSTADRAAMKRAAGTMLSEAGGNALRAFYRILPYGVYQNEESRYFAVGCLKCLTGGGQGEKKPLPALIGAMISEGALSDSAGHRAQALLDVPWDEEGYMLTKLCQMVKLVQAKSPAAIDYEGLLADLLAWNHEKQYVQRNWARSIYQSKPNNFESEKGE